METHPKLSSLTIFPIIIVLAFCASCALDISRVDPDKQPHAERLLIVSEQNIAIPPKIEEEQGIGDPLNNEQGESPPLSEGPENCLLSPARGTQQERGISSPPEVEEGRTAALPKIEEEQGSLKRSDQEILDSALGFCQASNDFWEQGDLENAIDALDQAYSLILEVDSDQNPEVLQQLDDLRFTISKRIIQCYSSRFTVANGYNKAIPVVINRHVEGALELLKGRDRKFFLDAYRRSGRYRPAITRALQEAGLPEELSWLPLIESGFKVRALSRARALGLWQFVASTGYKFGLKRDRWVDERMDPEKSTRAAIAYLKELHQIFGDWATVLAAYNCGEGTVLRRIRNQRINYLDDFWDLYEKLPTETAFYVPKFLAVLHILNDPEAHDFALPPVDEEIETEEVAVDKQIHLKTAAKYLEIPYGVLEDLNSALRHNLTPQEPYALRVPKGKGVELLSKLDEIPVWRPTYVMHRVRAGECLSVIARRYRTSIEAIMRLNGLKRSHLIRAGWSLKIPTTGTYASIEEVPSPIPGSAVEEKTTEYVVQQGDSLWKIADRFGTTTMSIKSLNQLRGTRLRGGQVLVIPKRSTVLKEIETKTYTVLKGDSSYLIAKSHQMDLSQFLRINHLTPRSTIFPGQEVLVKAE
jgi:membrane-bound lytic murein transglycosylase D